MASQSAAHCAFKHRKLDRVGVTLLDIRLCNRRDHRQPPGKVDRLELGLPTVRVARTNAITASSTTLNSTVEVGWILGKTLDLSNQSTTETGSSDTFRTSKCGSKNERVTTTAIAAT